MIILWCYLPSTPVADLAEKQAMDVNATIQIAQETISALQSDLTKKEC